MANSNANIKDQDWKFNAITGANRTILAGLLNTNNKYLIVYDTNLDALFIWDGSSWQPYDPTTGGGGGATDKIIKTFTAGETISGGMSVMLSGSLVYKFDITNEANYGKCIGVSNTSSTSGNPIDIILEGTCDQAGGLSAGVWYYAGATAGQLVSTAPTGIMQIIGVALNSTTILVDLKQPIIII